MAKPKLEPKPKNTKGSAIVASTLKISKDKPIEGGVLKTVEVKGVRPKKALAGKAQDSVSYGAFTNKTSQGTLSRPKMSKEEYTSVNKELLGKEGDTEQSKQSKIMENMDKVKGILSRIRGKK